MRFCANATVAQHKMANPVWGWGVGGGGNGGSTFHSMFRELTSK
jgi:hypothetical protein